MKRLLLVLVLLAVSSIESAAQSAVYVKSYIRSDGTVVPGHYRSAPNATPLDNYSTKGNTNPYTGKVGTTNPYSLYSPSVPVARTYTVPQYEPSPNVAPTANRYISPSYVLPVAPAYSPYVSPAPISTYKPYTNPYAPTPPKPVTSWP